MPSPDFAERAISTSFIDADFFVKSILLRTMVTSSDLGSFWRIISSSGVTPVLSSTNKRARSACSISIQVRFIPSCSTTSSLSRNPAVSITCKGIPSILISSRKTSRVVPAIWVTMAESRPANAFNKLDLPVFGCPIRTTRMPSRNKTPCCADAKIFSISERIFSKLVVTWPSDKKSISSSGKSIAASTYIRK